ncbi:MAG: FAD-dependent oxidoreductase [Betaproteobacteria bacterium]|nr:FAD-dependent oxidoreductase [Betaproteobacteria bacterium]
MDPIVIIGSAADRMPAVNDLADYSRFREAISGAARVAILGAGLIGCEFANDLAATGYRVTVIEPAPHPLGRLVPPAVGEAMERGLAAIGVVWRLGAKPVSVSALALGLKVDLDDGSAIEADVVLSATPTPVVYPAMPVVVKTPALPLVVAPPLAGAAGDWEVEAGPSGTRSLFRNGQGEIAGFALTGTVIAEKNALLAKLGPWLAEAARVEA